MHNFNYYLPTKIIFGENTSVQLAPELKKAGINTVVVLTGGKSVYSSGLYDLVTKSLDDEGIKWECVSGVQPNPRLSKTREAVDMAKKINAKAIVPIGGGSVFDCSKAVALGAGSKNDIWDIMAKKMAFDGALPVYGILTLSGTSSEINSTFVITNEETQEKFAFANDVCLPTLSIVDPTLQYTVPLQQIMHCGVDALSHILEAYFAGETTSQVIIEHCESYSRAIIRDLRAMPSAQQDYEVRSELCFCSIFAHSGWASVGRPVRGDFSSHKIGHGIGGMFDIAHGVTIGIMMSAWFKQIYDLDLARPMLARFARNVFGLTSAPNDDFALAAVNEFKAFVKSLDMPVSLSEVGIKESDLDAIAENAARTLPFGCVQPMSYENIRALLQVAL